MKTTCIINNFNYGQYLEESIESALRQSVPFDEILVVDDCSTDDSRRIVEEKYSGHERIKPIFRRNNGGQLSCFNEGFLHTTGDIVFFLDADDKFKLHYLEEVLTIYKSKPWVDSVFTGFQKFGLQTGTELPAPHDYFIRCSVLITLFDHMYLGVRTSTMSIKKKVLDQILPLQLEEAWRIRADDCLIWGSSIVGASKYFLAKPLAEYRVHGSNHWYGTQSNIEQQLRRSIAMNAYFNYFLHKRAIDESILKGAHLEFRIMPNPSFKLLRKYVKMILLSNIALRYKLKNIIRMLRHYVMREKTDLCRRSG